MGAREKIRTPMRCFQRGEGKGRNGTERRGCGDGNDFFCVGMPIVMNWSPLFFFFLSCV